MILFYINDSLLDTYPDTVVAQTFKAFDLTTFNTQFRNFTNSFTVPFTENNNTILGNANLIQSDTSVPYTENTCRVIQNGVEIVNNGTPVLRGTNDRGYDIFIISGLSFFDAVGANRLVDLDFTGGINGELLTGDSSVMNTTTGRIQPVLNYGNFDVTNYLPDYAMFDENALPSFYYHSIINQIFTDAGFSKSGSIFSDTKYLKTIVPFGRSDFAYGGTFIEDRIAIASKSAGQSITSGNLATTDITFPVLVKNGTLGYWDGTSEYEAIEADATSGDRVFGLTVQLTIDITVTGGTVDLIVNNGNFSDLQTNIGTGTYTSEVSDGEALVSTALSIRANINSGTPNITVNSGQVSWIPSVVPPIGTNSYVYFNLLLPEILQRDFLMDFSLRFGQLFQEIDGTVFCKSIDDVISDTANAIDWTDRRVRQPDKITYSPTGLAKKNYLRYQNTDFQVSKDFAEGLIEVSNFNLKDEMVLTSLFGASATELVGDIYMAKVNIYDGTQASPLLDFTYNPGIRVLLVRDRYSYESAVKVRADISSTTSYKVAYFDDPAQANTCRWQQSIDNEYPLYVEALQKYKLVTREYYLTESDIQNLDFFKPIFDTDSYYLLNTVGPYIPGRLTRVSMMKI